MLKLYNKILSQQLTICLKHSIKYKLGRYYDYKYDAIGMTYYFILDNHSDNKQLISYAKKQFMK